MKLVRISAVWCSSCILTEKIWNTLKENHSEFEYVDLDYDFDDIEEYNIGEIIPVIIIYKDGIEVSRIIGETSLDEVEKKLGEV